MEQVLDAGRARTRLVEDSKSIDQVEIRLETQGDLNPFDALLKGKLVLEHIVDVAVGRSESS